jgi:beta-glucosidase
MVRAHELPPEGDWEGACLAPGESKQVAFPLGFGELSFYDVKMKRVVEPGRFEVMVGGSSDNVKKVNLDVAAR